MSPPAGTVRRYWMRPWYVPIEASVSKDEVCDCQDKCQKVVLASDYDLLAAQAVALAKIVLQQLGPLADGCSCDNCKIVTQAQAVLDAQGVQ